MPLCPVRALRFSVASLIVSLATAGPCTVALSAQTAAVAANQAAPKALFIEIIEGEGEINDIRARTAREPIVEVQDENHRPVAGALVLFSADPSGSARLINFSGSPTLSVRTGLDGRATATGFRTSHKTGEVRILVSATVAGITVEAVLHQKNAASGNRLKRTVSDHKHLLEASAGVGAAVVLAVLLTRKDATTIQAGTGVVRGIVVGRH